MFSLSRLCHVPTEPVLPIFTSVSSGSVVQGSKPLLGLAHPHPVGMLIELASLGKIGGSTIGMSATLRH